MKRSIVIILICFLLFLILLVVCKKDGNTHYEQIRKNIEQETIRYLNISSPNCSSVPMTIDEETLIVQAGMDRKKLLDIDNKSYCKTTVKAYCDETSQWQLDIKISCKDYEDEGYIDWGN